MVLCMSDAVCHWLVQNFGKSAIAVGTASHVTLAVLMHDSDMSAEGLESDFLLEM